MVKVELTIRIRIRIYIHRNSSSVYSDKEALIGPDNCNFNQEFEVREIDNESMSYIRISKNV